MPHKSIKDATSASASRRRFLAGSGAAAAVVASGFAPHIARAQASARAIVIGGGWGGISATRNLKTMMPSVDVTLIEPK